MNSKLGSLRRQGFPQFHGSSRLFGLLRWAPTAGQQVERAVKVNLIDTTVVTIATSGTTGPDSDPGQGQDHRC